jgi:hypothetical protein
MSTTNSKEKSIRRVATTGVAIAAVTLALVTAAVVVSMIPVQKAAALNCVSSPNGKNFACSGSGGSHSCSNGPCKIPISPSSTSVRKAFLLFIW